LRSRQQLIAINSLKEKERMKERKIKVMKQ